MQTLQTQAARHVIFLGLGVLLLMSTPAVQANLSFESKSLSVVCQDDENVITAVFTFKNESSDAIEIVNIESDCTCLRAESDQSIYAPGEQGKIEADYSPAERFGTRKQSLLVRFKDGSLKPIPLTVIVKVPSILKIEPEVTEWVQGEQPLPKIVTFKVLRKAPIHIIDLVSSRKNFGTKLTPIEEGRHYEIEITPGSTSTFTLGMIRIDTDCEIQSQRRQMAIFRVNKRQ